MLLLVDIGNTQTVVGCFNAEQQQLCEELRFDSNRSRTSDEYEGLLLPLLRARIGTNVAIKGAVVSSVVPPLTPVFLSLVERCFNCPVFAVGPGIKTGIGIKIANPRSVGADRIANAVAAAEYYALPALVVDFGTATTFDYIDADRHYCGGAIAPGLELGLTALVQRTAKLPTVELLWPQQVVGNDTVEAMQSGLMIGYACLVEGLIGRIVAERGSLGSVVATGGLGRVLFEHLHSIQSYDPQLTLKGLAVLAKLNF